jgi:hypothetical protein
VVADDVLHVPCLLFELLSQLGRLADGVLALSTLALESDGQPLELLLENGNTLGACLLLFLGLLVLLLLALP